MDGQSKIFPPWGAALNGFGPLEFDLSLDGEILRKTRTFLHSTNDSLRRMYDRVLCVGQVNGMVKMSSTIFGNQFYLAPLRAANQHRFPLTNESAESTNTK